MMLLLDTVRAFFLPQRGDWAMCVRFWGRNTREVEKLARLSPRSFFRCAIALPRPFRPKARSHYPITALCSFKVGEREPGFKQLRAN